VIVLAVIFISALPAMIHVWQESREEIVARLKGIFARRPSSDVE